jgi:amino acid transporter
VYAVLAYQTFLDLVQLNVVMYGAALVLESAALLVLRHKEPDLPRPFRIPGGWPVLGLVFALPVAMVGLLVGLTVKEDGWPAQRLTGMALLSGPLVYGAIALFRFRTAREA